jgi:hypothetical protein
VVRFSEEDRKTIWDMREAGVPVKRLAKHLGRQNGFVALSRTVARAIQGLCRLGTRPVPTQRNGALAGINSSC